MGYKLYREVMRWAPAALTKGEKLAALAIADDANDATRLTWHSVVDPELMRRALVPDDRAMLRIVAKLKAEKVLEHAGGGHNGRVAKYRFLQLEPVDAVVDPLGGENHHATAEGAGAEEGENRPATPGEGWQKTPPNSVDPDDGVHEITTQQRAKGGDFLPRRVVKTTTPTPPYPSSTTPSSLASLAPQAPADAAPEGGGGGGDVYDAQHAQRAAAFVDTLDYRGQTPSRGQRKKLNHRAATALAAGWTEQTLAGQLNLGDSVVNSAVAVYLHRLSEEVLEEPPTVPQPRAAVLRCPDCDEHGFHYRDPVLMTGPFRCPNRGQRAA